MAAKRDRVAPLLRAFSLLDGIVAADHPLTLAEVATQSGLPNPTVYRMLATLVNAALLRREPDGKRVSAGPALTRLALNVMLNAGARERSRAILQALVAEIGETCNLTMLDGPEVVYLDRVESAWPLRVSLHPGSRVPLHCTASGKLLLALLPTARRKRLLASLTLDRHTERTLTNPRKLEAELTRIRREGSSVDDQEFMTGLVCVAAPVALPSGRVVASVAVHAPVARMPLPRALMHLPALKRAAGAIGATFAEGAGQRPLKRSKTLPRCSAETAFS